MDVSGRKFTVRVHGRDLAMWWFLVLLTLPHMQPAYLALFPAIDNILDGWRWASFFITIFWMLLKRRITPVTVLISVYEIFIFISTIINDGEVVAAAGTAYSVIGVVFLYALAQDRGEVFYSSQLFCFELMIYINLATILIFPDGLFSTVAVGNLFTHTQNWFLGYYNNYTQYCIPALMFAWLYKLRTGKKFRTYCLTAAVAISAVRLWSGGVLVALGSMAIVYVFFKNRTSIFNYFSYWLLHIIFFVAVYVARLPELFAWLISDVLGKMTSLVFRIDLIHQTVRLVQKSPWIGYGIQNQLLRTAQYHQLHGVHAHNMLMEILYQGGFIGLGIWVAIVIVAGMAIYKYRNTPESKIVATAFLGWCVATLVEPFTSPFLMGMFVLAYYSKPERVGAVHPRKLPLRGVKT